VYRNIAVKSIYYRLAEPDGGVLLFENQGDAIRSKKYDAMNRKNRDRNLFSQG